MRINTNRLRLAHLILSVLMLGVLGLSTPARAAAAPVSFAGNWVGITDDAQYFMALQQVGNTVIGTFSPRNGKIEGTVTDNILLFKWTTVGGTGSGRLVMDKTQTAFHGTYSLGTDPQIAQGFWYGTRAAVSFAGVWKVTGGMGPFTFKLNQNGSNQVAGEYTAKNLAKAPIFSVRAGVVTRDTLRFVATDAKGKILGDAEFVMDEGGKSFKGTLLDRAVTGTFVGTNP